MPQLDVFPTLTPAAVVRLVFESIFLRFEYGPHLALNDEAWVLRLVKGLIAPETNMKSACIHLGEGNEIVGPLSCRSDARDFFF